MVGWSGDAVIENPRKHLYIVRPASDRIELTCTFGEKPAAAVLPTVDEVQASAAAFWKRYWTEGGAVDLSQSTDPRAPVLERRIVLSQYLVGVNCATPIPPQETGLTANSWYGKAHLEMHWWHSVQFALWGKAGLLEQTMPWYQAILPKARATAQTQGYTGARWPKMIGPDGTEGPSDVAVFLIWQQPHPIYYAELLFRIRKDPALLERYKDIVFETAEFMTSYAHKDEAGQRYVLGPPLIPAQEKFPPRTTMNPTFELAYWAYGLELAQRWRERLGLPRDAKWEEVRKGLAGPPVRDGVYVNTETAPDTFGAGGPRTDHPSLLGAYGMLPGPNVDPAIMKKTLHKVLDTWNWGSTWGWDFPLTAMTAARVGEPQLAVETLLKDTPKNRFLPNGHNYKDGQLPVYLPGNGGLLAAVAMMAAGWDGAPDVHAPGFPKDGRWVVRWEGLERLP